jgi:DNA-binding CsgD family transcriptional regulator
VLSFLLQGYSTKSMALELGLSTSTVWSRRESALEKLGVRSVAELSLLLPTPALRGDADGEGPRREKAISCPTPFLALPVAAEGSAFILFAVAIPPLEPPGELTDAERAVVRGVIEGRSNRQIAAARATSPRTVANQLQSAFRKLRVSGRAELLHLCARRVSSGG